MGKVKAEHVNITITVPIEFRKVLEHSAEESGQYLSQYIRFTMEKHEAKKKAKAGTGRQPTTGE